MRKFELYPIIVGLENWDLEFVIWNLKYYLCRPGKSYTASSC